MACGSNKLKLTCPGKLYATCVFYETDLPEWSDYKEEQEEGGCIVLEETTEELYDEVGKLKTETDVTDLDGEDCFDYIEDGEGAVTVKTALETFDREIKLLKCPEDPSNNLDLTELELDMACLEDACGEPVPQTLKDVFQAVINAVCAEAPVTQTITNSQSPDLIATVVDIQTTTASSGSLATGREGQEITFVMTVAGGNYTLGIPLLSTGTSAVFNAINDHLVVRFVLGKWRIISNNSVTIS